MSLSRFILVRHGETTGNRDCLFYGRTDLPLTDTGHRQAAAVADYLKQVHIDSVLTSGLLRAQQTAEHIISPDRKAHTSEPQLNEMDFGDWEMCHFSEIATRFPADWESWINDWQNATPTNGEPFPVFAARVQTLADTLRQQGTEDPGTHLIVAHKGVLGLMIARWFGLPADAMWQFPCEQDSYSVVECRAGFMTLSVFNGRSPYTPVV
ncbi:MAG: alpha-ribazole phosphatase [Morganella sp. (in: enterobacteria)]